MSAPPVIPAVIFAYARPDHLARMLACLREDGVPLLYAFSDGPRTPAAAAPVEATRKLLRAIDWCEVRLVERAENHGLGRSILGGVSAVAAQHPAFVVWEDDLVCVPGTYAWMTAALRHYQDDVRVFSVGAWTHARVTPPGVALAPYFDVRAECWGWGSYARAWQGMEQETALQKMAACTRAGVPADVCGSDLPRMAREEAPRNLWAVRWLFHHLQHRGLCLRPPWSLSEHKGFDVLGTNASEQHAADWSNNSLLDAPPIPRQWPEPVAHPQAAELWRRALPPEPKAPLGRRAIRRVGRLFPKAWRDAYRDRFVNIRWHGDYPAWPAARADSQGYDAPLILARAQAAVRKVKSGQALFERDGVAFDRPGPIWPALDWITSWAKGQGGTLSVLDFGGSLGSRYFQHREAWKGLRDVKWRVVDQPAVVLAGREFADASLSFHESVAAAQASGRADLLLMSAVLQYVEDPHAQLRELLAQRFPVVVLGRAPIIGRGRHRLTVQRVPAGFSSLSYPCWQFDRELLLAEFAPDYRLALEFPGADGEVGGASYRGFIFVRSAEARTGAGS